jgi:hypothetical protein
MTVAVFRTPDVLFGHQRWVGRYAVQDAQFMRLADLFQIGRVDKEFHGLEDTKKIPDYRNRRANNVRVLSVMIYQLCSVVGFVKEAVKKKSCCSAKYRCRCNCLGMRWQSSLLIDAKRGILQNT